MKKKIKTKHTQSQYYVECIKSRYGIVGVKELTTGATEIHSVVNSASWGQIFRMYSAEYHWLSYPANESTLNHKNRMTLSHAADAYYKVKHPCSGVLWVVYAVRLEIYQRLALLHEERY